MKAPERIARADEMTGTPGRLRGHLPEADPYAAPKARLTAEGSRPAKCLAPRRAAGGSTIFKPEGSRTEGALSICRLKGGRVVSLCEQPPARGRRAVRRGIPDLPRTKALGPAKEAGSPRGDASAA